MKMKMKIWIERKIRPVRRQLLKHRRGYINADIYDHHTLDTQFPISTKQSAII